LARTRPSPKKEPAPRRALVGDLWHMAFAQAVTERGPSSFELILEFLLSIEPQRADMLLLRRRGRRSNRARLLRWLWPRLAAVTILEFKSPAVSSFRPGDFLRLVSYGVLYDAQHMAELSSPRDLTLALVLPAIVPALTGEIARMGWTLVPLGDGYARIDGAPYTVLVAAIDEVCQAEKDDFLAVFSRTQRPAAEAADWLRRWLTEATMKRRKMKNTQAYDEMFQKLLDAVPIEKRLAGLDAAEVLAQYDAKQRLAGLDPAERLAGLDAAQTIRALPLDFLRGLSQEYVRSLPADAQRELKKRLRAPRSASTTSRKPGRVHARSHA
jgi:hypothetical protein